MALNITSEELVAATQALAAELGCEPRVYLGSGGPHQVILKFTPGHGGSEPFFYFVFSLVFDSINDLSPVSTYLEASKGSAMVKIDHIDMTPANFTSFADVEAAMRELFASQDNLVKPKPKNIPADALKVTYKELSDFLYERASMNEDMDCDASGGMNVLAYSSKDDERSGIYINLLCLVNEDVDTGDENNPSITLVGAEREANDHEWEPYSSKKISVRNIKTLDDLLVMLEKNAKPKGKKPTP